jgi:hypothetical protein
MEAASDLGGGFNPAEGLGIVVPVGEAAGDRPFQTMDAVEAAAPNRLAGNRGEPTLDQVEPRGAGRGEVQLEAEIGGEPLLHRGMLVGAVVVADQVQLATGVAPGHRLTKGDELDVGMTLETASLTLPLATSSAANRLVVP